MVDDHSGYRFGVLYILPGVAINSYSSNNSMMDANVVIAKCVEAIYEAADRYKPARIGVAAGRVIPKSDGSQVVRIRVNINYPSGEEKFAPLDCRIDNVGNITLQEHRNE